MRRPNADLMDRNTISSEAADRLLRILILEEIPVHALLTLPSGTQTKVFGFVIESSAENGLIIAASRSLSSETGFIKILFLGIHTKVSYGNKREASLKERELLISEFGDSVLIIRFLESGGCLVLTFTLKQVL
jgi:hypothetical protein